MVTEADSTGLMDIFSLLLRAIENKDDGLEKKCLETRQSILH